MKRNPLVVPLEDISQEQIDECIAAGFDVMGPGRLVRLDLVKD